MSTKTDINTIAKECRNALKEGQEYLAIGDRVKAFGAFERAENLAFDAKEICWSLTNLP